MHRLALPLAVVAAVVLPAAGCGKSKNLAEVVGVLTLDGKPIQGAMVTFIPNEGGRPATGNTNELGEYTLGTFEPGDGAAPGEYGIAVLAQVATPTGKMQADLGDQPEVKIKWIVPEKYSQRETSKLTAKVEAGKKNEVPLALKSK